MYVTFPDLKIEDKLLLRIVAIDLNSAIPEVSSDSAMMSHNSAVFLLQDDVSFGIVILELSDEILDFHFFFLPALIQARVRALHFFSS